MKTVSFAVITVDNIVKTYFLEFRDHIFTASIDNHGDVGGSKLLRNVGQCLPYYVRFQVLTAASMMFRAVFWVVLPGEMIVDRRFRGAYSLHCLMMEAVQP
jgi:hypothetical protein